MTISIHDLKDPNLRCTIKTLEVHLLQQNQHVLHLTKYMFMNLTIIFDYRVSYYSNLLKKKDLPWRKKFKYIFYFFIEVWFVVV